LDINYKFGPILYNSIGISSDRAYVTPRTEKDAVKDNTTLSTQKSQTVISHNFYAVGHSKCGVATHHDWDLEIKLTDGGDKYKYIHGIRRALTYNISSGLRCFR